MIQDEAQAVRDAQELRDAVDRAADILIEYLFAPKSLLEKLAAALDGAEDGKADA